MKYIFMGEYTTIKMGIDIVKKYDFLLLMNSITPKLEE